MKKQVIFPTTLPARPKDGQGRSYGGYNGHGITRVVLNPRLEKKPEQSWAEVLEQFEAGLGMDLGEQIGIDNGVNAMGPFRLRVGKHPQFGIVALAIVAGEVTAVATFEMGQLNHATPDMQAFMDSIKKMHIAASS